MCGGVRADQVHLQLFSGPSGGNVRHPPTSTSCVAHPDEGARVHRISRSLPKHELRPETAASSLPREGGLPTSPAHPKHPSHPRTTPHTFAFATLPHGACQPAGLRGQAPAAVAARGRGRLAPQRCEHDGVGGIAVGARGHRVRPRPLQAVRVHPDKVRRHSRKTSTWTSKVPSNAAACLAALLSCGFLAGMDVFRRHA